ncbi:MAG: DUF2157 domain-containing protein [Candidatus Dactylopiibacterium carminicum]|uniref:DUF2157 domain-containing protein n=1 Tax=Candidatus Dactylopiibacterium carminicum TaxID=857335 RepID=A0A272EPF4_9RHOO|nr:DUF2157 domain-containing protein [Candidatus Dactylopiibacterium carminicum]KAF7599147.1 DUF2157 domain-containing protein [Candidatus Dactylopiibacterium carminicum]PAS92002.1 MAG: DUF2157 domain-containing protein [Candidatus Dactylopiibacterium carminicum]PAS95270.1 MAG: DUF2157 domain-containing protein [Candidatus Dactylopiibacterium carminicum]PAS99165.1 MAG: DUF2157 domain-containing protein [Candidatus Dactylopiibacterium carminicum]
MKITHASLEEAARQGLIGVGQVAPLWDFLQAQTADQPSFRFTHILYYFGGLIAIGAMTLFMNLGWERFGGWGLFWIALAYAGAGLWLTEHFLHRLKLAIPAGIAAAFVVALAPLAIYGLQVAFGWWADGRVYRDYHAYIDWRWLIMELGTLAVGAVMLWRYRLPFLVMPVAATLWYMSMDLAPFLFGATVDWEMRKFVSLWFGLLMILFAFWVDVRSRQARDYPFWLYLFGVLAFWGGLSMLRSDSELGKFLYLCVNLLMIGVGATLARRVFVVCGGLGAAGYVGHLAYEVFRDSMLFPFLLTLIGLGVIWLGILWQRREEAIAARLRAFLPAPLRALVARRH